MTTTIVAIGGLAVGCVVVEKILLALGKPDMAQMANVAGFSLASMTAIGLVVQVFNKVKTVFN
jgi:stage III sporulation protein AC